MIVRELISRFGFDVDKGDFKRVEGNFSKLKKIASAAVAFVAAGAAAKAFASITEEVAALGDAVDKTSKRIGVDAQALQELQFAAGLAGASHRDLATGLRVLSKNALEAADGTATYKDEFDRLGVSVRDGNGQLKSAEVLLTEMGDGLSRLKTETEKVAVAQVLMGRGGAMLLPLLSQGTSAIMQQRIEAQQLGLFNQDLIDLSVDLTDTNLRYSQSMQSIKNVLAKQFLPGVIRTKKAIVEWVKANRVWISQGLDAVFNAIGRAFTFVGRVLTPLVWAVKGIGFALRVVWEIAKGIAGAIFDMGQAIVNLMPTWAKWLLAAVALAAALFLPGIGMILLHALIALLIEDFVLWWEEGDKANTAMGRLDKSLGGMLGSIREWVQTAGEIEDWGQVWEGLLLTIGDAWDSLWAGVVETADKAWAKIERILAVAKTIPAMLNPFAGDGGDGGAYKLTAEKVTQGIQGLRGGGATATPSATTAGAQGVSVSNATSVNVTTTSNATAPEIAKAITDGIARQQDAINRRTARTFALGATR